MSGEKGVRREQWSFFFQEEEEEVEVEEEEEEDGGAVVVVVGLGNLLPDTRPTGIIHFLFSFSFSYLLVLRTFFHLTCVPPGAFPPSRSLPPPPPPATLPLRAAPVNEEQC